MTEEQAFCNQFEEECKSLRSEKIMLYGSGEKTEILLKNVRGFDFQGILDPKLEGEHLYGAEVVPLQEAVDRSCIIIIVARNHIIPIIYDRIHLFCEENGIKIYDFHGVVPEELLFMGNEEGAEKLGSEESVIVKNATYIVVANNAMKRHILKKYPSCKSEFILFPMNNADNDRDGNGELGKNNSGKPVVIYSGGLQKWQLIPEMQDAMERQKTSFDYRMYVSDTEEFMKLWSDRERPDTWRVDTLSADELKKEYEKAQYGFTLRDDIIVNEVACPTKLIDYVKYGIIPILKSDKIGDFVENGLEYVRIEDFINGRIPLEEKRVQMVQNNFSVMGKIYDDYKKGLKELQEILERI